MQLATPPAAPHSSTSGQRVMGKVWDGLNRWKTLDWFAGWWLTYPPEKWWTSSVGMMTFPTEWKVIKAMFQSTNQLWYIPVISSIFVDYMPIKLVSWSTSTHSPYLLHGRAAGIPALAELWCLRRWRRLRRLRRLPYPWQRARQVSADMFCPMGSRENMQETFGCLPTLTLWLCQNSYWKWPSRNSGFTQ